MSKPTQIEDLAVEFWDAGYVFVRKLFDQEEVSGLQASAKASRALQLESKVRKDATGGVTRLVVRNDLDDDSSCTAVVRSKRVVDLMEQLLADEVYHYHHKMMMKRAAWWWCVGMASRLRLLVQFRLPLSRHG